MRFNPLLIVTKHSLYSTTRTVAVSNAVVRPWSIYITAGPLTQVEGRLWFILLGRDRRSSTISTTIMELQASRGGAMVGWYGWMLMSEDVGSQLGRMEIGAVIFCEVKWSEVNPTNPTFPHISSHSPIISPQIPQFFVGIGFPGNIETEWTSQKSHLVKTSYTAAPGENSVCCRGILISTPTPTLCTSVLMVTGWKCFFKSK
jgi:hypothetical protein